MNTETTIKNLLYGLIEMATIHAEWISDYDDLNLDPHWRALDELVPAIDFIGEITWRAIEQSIHPVNTYWGGDQIWISPRTDHCLDHLTTNWGDPIRNLGNLVSMITADQHHLADMLVHPDDAATRLGLKPEAVLDLAYDGLLSYTEIEGVTFVVDDKALERAAEDLDAWAMECGA